MIKPESIKLVKEWSAVVDALGKGIQTILLRKYPPAYREFFLYPTYSYASGKTFLNMFQETYRGHVEDSVKSKTGGVTSITCYALVTEVVRIGRGELGKLGNLSSYFIWSRRHVTEYFSDSKLEAAYMWILRIYRLVEPKLIKDLGGHAIKYANLPEPIPTSNATPVLEDSEFSSIIDKVKKAMETPIVEKPVIKPPEEMPDHNEVRDMIWMIGKYEGKVSEKEYPIDNYRLDVAWRRIKAGNPSHVFEVQMGGNFFEALTKLKHAWDMWNSWPVLVTTEVYASKARELLDGSFHEMGHIAKIVDWKKIVRLFELETDVASIKNELGL